jgi:hypothetical protein
MQAYSDWYRKTPFSSPKCSAIRMSAKPPSREFGLAYAITGVTI